MEYFARLGCLEELEEKLKRLHQVWNEIGYDEENKISRENLVKKHVLEMFEMMVLEEESSKNQIVKSIEDLLRESAQLSAEIGVKFTVDDHEYESLPLCKVEVDLQEKLSEYRLLKQQRISKYASLREKESQLCDILGIDEKYEIPNVLPSEEQLSQFEIYVELKAAEKARLTKFFYQTRLSIIEIMNELEMTPMLEFEKIVVCADENSFKLSKDNIAKLKELHHTLVQKLEETKALSMELREKLSKLWDRLYESFDARTSFLNAHSGYSIKTIDALKNEIKRCEERKRQNIKIFVEKIRGEMLDLWNKCCFGEGQRRKFIPYLSDYYTEDLLDLHELELEKLKKYYETNKPVFQLLEKRQKLWDKMVNLESKANDRKRLFDNRGGQLLQEEKERKTIQKELPKIELQLSNLVKCYQEQSNEPFLFYDQKLSNLIEDQWNEHKENKEKEKLARRARGTETEFKQPTKRKLCPTPCSSTSKLTQTTYSNTKVSRNLFSQKSTLQSTAGSHFIKNQRDGTHIQHVSIASTTYADFEAHLESADTKTQCRSSMKRRCLRERNETPLRPQTRTPVCKSAPPVLRPKLGLHQQVAGGIITPAIRRMRTPMHTPPSSVNRTCRLAPTHRGKLPIII